MCDVDADGFGQWTVHRARRDRQCSACEETITAGSAYHRYAGVNDGAWFHVDQCGRCHAMWSAIATRSRAAVMLVLNCGESWQDAFGADPPPEVAALAFALPHELQPDRPPKPVRTMETTREHSPSPDH